MKGYQLLKADFHIHTSEDIEDLVTYSATELIDMAAGFGYSVLAITNHNLNIWTEWLRDYARERGIILIPGMEATIQGKHVLLYNFDFASLSISRLSDLYALKDRNNMIIAPHPCYPSTVALGRLFHENISLFDAVELSHFWCRSIDFNQGAVRAAKEHGLPLVGTSDAHQRRQFHTTWSELDAELDPACVIEAVKAGRITPSTSPLSLGTLIRINALMVWRNHIVQRVSPRRDRVLTKSSTVLSKR